MTLMTGAEYRQSLDDGRQIWIGGERVTNVATHPAFRPMVTAMSAIYDLQHHPAHQDALTFRFEDGTLGQPLLQAAHLAGRNCAPAAS